MNNTLDVQLHRTFNYTSTGNSNLILQEKKFKISFLRIMDFEKLGISS